MPVTNVDAVQIEEYITPQALNALYVLEGHYNGPETPTSYKGNKEKTTTYYGMTDAGLATIRASKLQIPEYLKKATASTLTKEQAREAAGYLAAAHTKKLDEAYGDESNQFSRLPLAWRSAILTLAHSNGVNGWIDSYKKGNSGSLLKAIKTGDREIISRYMMAKEDGGIMDEPHGSNKSGRINRILASVKMMYDTECKAFKDAKAKDATFKRWTDNEFTVRNVQNHLYNIHIANLHNREYEDELREFSKQNLLLTKPDQNPVVDGGETVQDAEPQQQEKDGLLANLTKPIKKLFTNREEKQNVAQGNTNINLQQSASAPGGGTNQLPAGPNDQSSKAV